MKPSSHFITTLLLWGAAISHAQQVLPVGHYGALDPATEGFTLRRSGSPVLEPVTGDFGRDAWTVSLNAPGDVAIYSYKLSASEQAALAAGWTLSATLRVSAPLGSAEGNFVSFSTSKDYFSLGFGTQSNGDPIVSLASVPGSPSYTLTGHGPGYHTYEWKYDAALGSASLWVDGAEFLAGLAGSPSVNRAALSWGGGQNSIGSASANWAAIALAVVPEPSCPMLLGLGGALLWLARRRLLPRSGMSG